MIFLPTVTVTFKLIQNTRFTSVVTVAGRGSHYQNGELRYLVLQVPRCSCCDPVGSECQDRAGLLGAQLLRAPGDILMPVTHF